VVPRYPTPIAIGTGEILREGDRVALLGYGTGVAKALSAAEILAERGISATVADARFAKPIDAGLAAQLAAEHGVDGFLVQPGDVKEAARYAIEILSRPDRGREMGQTARLNAKKNFCSNDVIPAYENYYKRVLSES